MTWDLVENPPFNVVTEPLSLDRQPAWQSLQTRLSIGSLLTGKIFARTHFGIFYDAGLGFPIRMNVTDFGRAEGGMIFPDDYPPLMSEISGQLAKFDSRLHQLVTVRISL